MKNTKNQAGFSLVELLVVVIIIGIIAAIAIPSLLASRRSANEASAISSLRTIHSSEATYYATTGAGASYGNLTALQGDGLIDSVLGGGAKSSYNFVATTGTNNYCATAIPTSGGGSRTFAVSTPGVIFQLLSTTTAPSCDAATGIISTGSPIQ